MAAGAVPDLLGRGVEFVFGWVGERPIAAGVLAGVCLLVVLAVVVRSRSQVLDPVRMFTGPQRVEGFARAGGRCELDGWIPGLRCRRPAQHGDHFHPWSRGGATSMNNFVAACAPCNMSKSNRVPAPWLGWVIRARRRRYFPAGVPRRPGEKYS